MRVLVTGGAGSIGRATSRALVEAGHRVRIVSRDAWPGGSMFEKLGVATPPHPRSSTSARSWSSRSATRRSARTPHWPHRAAPGWTDPYLRSKVGAELVGRNLEASGLPRVTIHPGTVIRWWAEHGSIDRAPAGKLAPRPV